MDDYSILFFCILMFLVFSYRIVLCVLFLVKKKYLLDEKYYISFFYLSIVGILVLFTNWRIIGIVLSCLLPIFLTLYVTFSKSRVYWIKNGYFLTESTFINEISNYDKKYSETSYRLSKIRFSKKKSENRIKVSFSNLEYMEKEKLLSIITSICKNKTQKSNKRELVFLLIYFLCILADALLAIFVLFT